MLLVILIREHATHQIDTTIECLTARGPLWYPFFELLLDELTLLKIEQVEVGRVRHQIVQGVFASALVLRLNRAFSGTG